FSLLCCHSVRMSPRSTLFPYTTLFRSGFASGVGVTGGGLCSTGAARIEPVAKISEVAKANVIAKRSRELWWIIRQRNSIRERKRSEEHTSELQSRFDLVCRLLLEKKKN